jgi:hypothetical protein
MRSVCLHVLLASVTQFAIIINTMNRLNQMLLTNLIHDARKQFFRSKHPNDLLSVLESKENQQTTHATPVGITH